MSNPKYVLTLLIFAIVGCSKQPVFNIGIPEPNPEIVYQLKSLRRCAKG